MGDLTKLIVCGLLVVAVPAFAIKSCVNWHEQRPETIARKAEEAARIDAERRPRKISEADGCEVWTFKPASRWLYFARCGAKTETTTAWDECRSVTQGKTTRTECTPHSAAVPQEPKQ